MSFETVGLAKFIVLQTFRKNGLGVSTPVSVAAQNGKLYVFSLRNTGKVKRVRNNPQVKVCEGDRRGTPQGEWVVGQARILEAPEEIKKGLTLLTAKNGFVYRAVQFLRRLFRPNEAVVILEISPVIEG